MLEHQLFPRGSPLDIICNLLKYSMTLLICTNCSLHCTINKVLYLIHFNHCSLKIFAPIWLENPKRQRKKRNHKFTTWRRFSIEKFVETNLPEVCKFYLNWLIVHTFTPARRFINYDFFFFNQEPKCVS